MMLIGVAIVSLLPMPATGVSDKLAHLLTYFVLAGWFAVIARDRVVLAWSLIGLVAYGMLIEVLQGQTGYRYAEWGDVLANGSGCVIGSLLYFTPLRRLLRLLDVRLASLLRR
jgi:VanZ family protein